MPSPIIANVASIMAGTAVNQSSSLTATIVNTAGYEIQVPIRVRFSNVSADPVITVYRSTDNGTNFDTTGITSFSVARVAAGTGQTSLSLTTGVYALQLTNSGPNTATFQILTQLVVTAIS